MTSPSLAHGRRAQTTEEKKKKSNVEPMSTELNSRDGTSTYKYAVGPQGVAGYTIIIIKYVTAYDRCVKYVHPLGIRLVSLRDVHDNFYILIISFYYHIICG